MDAYSSYILTLAEAQASYLRRETAEYGMSRAARGSRISRWTRTVVGAVHAVRAATAARRRTGGPAPSPTVLRAQ